MPEQRRKLIVEATRLMGHDYLARALAVKAEDVADWITGREDVPEDKLLGIAQAAIEFAKRPRV